MSGRAPDGSFIEAAAIVYISPDASTFYLSMEVMVQLKIIPKTFPQVGAAVQESTNTVTVASVEAKAPCGCLLRSKPPPRYSKLPYPPLMENVSKMKDRLLKDYASSTFNQCEHQQLPCMAGPDLEIHVDENAQLANFTTPATVPLHWQEKVKQKLEQNVAMGVMETPLWRAY